MCISCYLLFASLFLCDKSTLTLAISLYIHLFIVLLNRPFIGPCTLAPGQLDRPVEEIPAEALIIRRIRVMAFCNARTAALQIMGLLRHTPPLSPCHTTPFVISTASTVLLLSPRDLQAMNGVRVGLECLDALCMSGFWSQSGRDAKRRIIGLAKRWGVELTNKDPRPQPNYSHSGSSTIPTTTTTTAAYQNGYHTDSLIPPLSAGTSASSAEYPSEKAPQAPAMEEIQEMWTFVPDSQPRVSDNVNDSINLFSMMSDIDMIDYLGQNPPEFSVPWHGALDPSIGTIAMGSGGPGAQAGEMGLPWGPGFGTDVDTMGVSLDMRHPDVDEPVWNATAAWA